MKYRIEYSLLIFPILILLVLIGGIVAGIIMHFSHMEILESGTNAEKLDLCFFEMPKYNVSLEGSKEAKYNYCFTEPFWSGGYCEVWEDC